MRGPAPASPPRGRGSNGPHGALIGRTGVDWTYRPPSALKLIKAPQIDNMITGGPAIGATARTRSLNPHVPNEEPQLLDHCLHDDARNEVYRRPGSSRNAMAAAASWPTSWMQPSRAGRGAACGHDVGHPVGVGEAVAALPPARPRGWPPTAGPGRRTWRSPCRTARSSRRRRRRPRTGPSTGASCSGRRGIHFVRTSSDIAAIFVGIRRRGRRGSWPARCGSARRPCGRRAGRTPPPCGPRGRGRRRCPCSRAPAPPGRLSPARGP